ncbi:hypothetical protein [Stenotrophobium rhamnosiphilum]|uniref:Lipoprotein n=1 Tax=Stenotrophobium rhamnosiphilum TaxID=2029166 RepID=A0A2T5MIL3_9GAMM|nr:hypothetical protein [Stenotrophobium rhamnosiphilum]PTU32412.1 hypothetical protein CJD38_07115 [Stenotrophobium rhamnosiphilum]
MRSIKSLLYLIPLVVAGALSGCGVNKALIAGAAEGPKQIFINLQGDPLLIAIELKTLLAAKGYEVALNTEEAGKTVVQNTNTGSVIYKNVSDSRFRYELTLGYVPIQERIQLVAASIRDREQNKILGTYRWSWNQLAPAPTIERAIEMIDENLLVKVFR